MPDLSERIRDLVETAEVPLTLSEVREIVEGRPTVIVGPDRPSLQSVSCWRQPPLSSGSCSSPPRTASLR
jgi:hypothetical protein